MTKRAQELAFNFAKDHPDLIPLGSAVLYDVERLLEQYGRKVREACAEVVDQCNREGPYNAIGAGSRIREMPLP